MRDEPAPLDEPALHARRTSAAVEAWFRDNVGITVTCTAPIGHDPMGMIPIYAHRGEILELVADSWDDS